MESKNKNNIGAATLKKIANFNLPHSFKQIPGLHAERGARGKNNNFQNLGWGGGGNGMRVLKQLRTFPKLSPPRCIPGYSTSVL